MSNHWSQLFIFGIRGISIGFKALFVFFAAKVFSLSDLGHWALINTALGIGLIVIGFNFYSYTSREIQEKNKNFVLSNHFIFTTFSALIILGFTPLLSTFNIIQKNYLPLFVVILFLEHAFSELYRVLLPLNKVVFANSIHLIRTLSSSLIPFIYYIVFKEISLSKLLEIWAISLAVACFLTSLYFLCKHKKQIKFEFSRSFIEKGIKTSLVYLLISILARGLFSIDKFTVQNLFGAEATGIYSFYFSMAFTIQTLVETSIVSPSIVAFMKANDLKQKIIKLVVTCFIVSIALSTFLLLILDHILLYLNKEQFINYSYLAYYLLTTAVIYTLGLCLMMPLYVLKRDFQILKAFTISFLIFIFLNFFHNDALAEISLNLLLSNIVLLAMLLFSLTSSMKTKFN